MKNLTIAGLSIALITMVLLGCSKENEDKLAYLPLLVPDKIWAQGADIPWAEVPGLYFGQFDKIGSDTIVDGIKWYKYYVSREENPVNYQLYGFLHEDSAKIYFRWKNSTGNAISTDGYPRLLYDFTLEVGDEIQLQPWQSEEWLPYHVYTVDSIKYLPAYYSQRIRKHMYLSPKLTGAGYVVWIEGIGSIYGLMNNESIYGQVGAATIVLCCKENGQQIFQNTEYNTCYLGSDN